MKTSIRYTSNMERAVAEVAEHNGQVTVICSPNVFIANLPDRISFEKLQESQSDLPQKMDDLSEILFTSWQQQENSNFMSSKIYSWDDPEHHNPKHPGNDFTLSQEEAMHDTATSRYMRGKITVGLIIVSGTDERAFTQKEIENVYCQVLRALNTLASYDNMANVVFQLYGQVVQIDAAPCNSGCKNCGTKTLSLQGELCWRDPVLNKMGYSAGIAGIDQFNKDLIKSCKVDWAYTAFITKYPQCWFAYAGSGRVCMSYSNDNWGPNNIAAVFAHETCHIFGAADEYASACSCGNYGEMGVPNNNCDKCHTEIRKTSCLMKGNDLGYLCPWTRGQLGWAYAEIGAKIKSVDWARYYRSMVTFTENGKNYIFAQSESDKRWFMAELSTSWDGYNEIKSGNWLYFYETMVTFKENGKNYLLAQSRSGNHWFISELSTSWDGYKEVKCGDWLYFYDSMVSFTENGKNYLFAHSNMGGHHWYMSELSTTWDGYKEVKCGNWLYFYGTMVSFTENGKNYFFAHSSMGGNHWFISELSTSWDGNKEIKCGGWYNFYSSSTLIQKDGKTFGFFQSSNKRWFISVLSPSWNGSCEVSSGSEDRFYGAVVSFIENKNNYIFAQSSTGKKCFMAEILAGCGKE